MNGRKARMARRGAAGIKREVDSNTQAGEPQSNAQYVRVNATGQILCKPKGAREIYKLVKKAIKKKMRGE